MENAPSVPLSRAKDSSQFSFADGRLKQSRSLLTTEVRQLHSGNSEFIALLQAALIRHRVPAAQGLLNSPVPIICFTLYSLLSPFLLWRFPLYNLQAFPHEQHSSVCLFPITSGFITFIPLFSIYDIVLLLNSLFFVNSVKLIFLSSPFSLFVVSGWVICIFMAAHLVSLTSCNFLKVSPC